MQSKLKWNTSNTHVKYWESINEMPMFNWVKCGDGDLKYVTIELIDEPKQNQIQYDKLYDQYLERFGLSDEFERYRSEEHTF